MSKGKATLHWDRQYESDLAGFRAYAATASGGPWTLVADTPLFDVTIGDFSSNGTWYFAITSYDLTGNESAKTSAVSKVITRPLTAITRTVK